jgi:hypothetical protein
MSKEGFETPQTSPPNTSISEVLMELEFVKKELVASINSAR